MLGRKFSALISGFALFSMFFGAGNLVFPLMLGQMTGSESGIALWGLLITAVLCPLVGLLAMMLYDGKYSYFFGRIGKWPGFLVLLIIQLIVGPFGSIPRLITLTHATVQPYLPSLSLPLFSVLAVGLIFALTIKPQRIVDLLGSILTPILIAALTLIVVMGLYHHPEPNLVEQARSATFVQGLKVGYNTLDLIAAFLFATLVLGHFRHQAQELPKEARRKHIMRHFLQASLIAVVLLGATYGGLCLVSAYHTPHMAESLAPERLISALAQATLGTFGGLVSSIAVAMACLTTAISLTTIFATYARDHLARGRLGHTPALLITLIISALMANLGFGGIAKFLGPILEVVYPGMIVLSVLNIAHKLYEFRPVKVPVLTTFGVAAIGHFVPLI